MHVALLDSNLRVVRSNAASLYIVQRQCSRPVLSCARVAVKQRPAVSVVGSLPRDANSNQWKDGRTVWPTVGLSEDELRPPPWCARTRVCHGPCAAAHKRQKHCSFCCYRPCMAWHAFVYISCRRHSLPGCFPSLAGWSECALLRVLRPTRRYAR